jgi:hypothetical protein
MSWQPYPTGKTRQEVGAASQIEQDKSPGFTGLSAIARAGYGHLSPTLAYRFVEIIRLP